MVVELHNIITINEMKKLTDPVYIDVRSPAEFAEGHIIGAINIPLLDNDERALVGTIYAHEGPNKAKEVGLSVVSPKLPDLIAAIKANAAQERTVIVYCWRGGMRSKSMVVMLGLAGIEAYQLEGGYKSYRRAVLKRLQEFDFKPEVFVICGSTGAGKTLLLQELARLSLPVVDLEGLANHRGSVFGQVGLGKQTTAQQFDSLLLAEMEKLQDEPFVIVECESKRIGNVYLPDSFFNAMKKGKRFLLKTSMAVRTTRLIEEYEAFSQARKDEILSALHALEKRIGKKQHLQLQEMFAQKKMQQFVESLLVSYYDPLYGYEDDKGGPYILTADGDDLEQAAEDIRTFLINHCRG